MSDVSKSLGLLTENERIACFLERIAVFLSELLICSLFAHVYAKNEQFAQKTDERIPNPD